MEDLYSHYSSDNKKKLETHLKNVAMECKNIISHKNLNLTIITEDELARLSFLIGAIHDFGKSTTFFQKYLVHGEENVFSHHGLISGILAYILIKKDYGKLIAMIGYMIVKRHHGNLESPLEDCGETFYHIQMQIQDIKQNSYNQVRRIYDDIFKDMIYSFEELIDELEEFVMEIDDVSELFRDILLEDIYQEEDESIELFLITNLLYSVLIDTDKKDAARLNNDYFEGAAEEFINVHNYISKNRKEKPEKYKIDIPINKARSDFFRDVTNNPKIKTTNYLYSLTAPTGIGKTFASFAFANKLRRISVGGQKIIYCLPYTSIIDQNYDEFEKIIDFNLKEIYRKNPTKYLLKHHYITPMELKKDIDLEKDSAESLNMEGYLDNKLLLESWESGNIVTTFVQLLQSIIGNKNSYLKKFHNIVNSIIILDEVQNIPVEYYNVVGKVLKILAYKFNTHILLMTATQPEIISGTDIINLVNEKKYSKRKVFDRVNLKIIDQLSISYNIAEFIEYLESNFKSNTGLIVCNTISSALNIYQQVYESFSPKEYQVYSLTTNLIPIDRLKKIKEINKKIDNGEKIIVISTQLIEAGVNMSYEEVFRDFAPLDSIVQVAGRCNRSGELSKKGKVNIVMLVNDEGEKYCTKVYDNTLLEICKEVLSENKSFSKMSEDYFSEIRNKYKRESDHFLNAICNLNYSKETNNQNPISRFKIINNQRGKTNVVICKNEDIENKIAELKDIYAEIKLVRNRKKLNKLIAKKEIINKQLSQYIISVYKNQLREYEKHHIINKFRFIKYVSYKDQKKYLYDENIGFCKEPKKPFQTTVFT
ncbi:CRISPR-associated helicase Cas3' [Natronospora cellulosivora (SeqCode)]